jgi:hypothetical protein
LSFIYSLVVAALKIIDAAIKNNFTLAANSSAQSIGLLLNCLSVAFADRLVNTK